MNCNKCKHIIVCHAFCSTTCENCGESITTGHMPGYKLCIKCSTELGRCQQCGKSIEDTNKK